MNYTRTAKSPQFCSCKYFLHLGLLKDLRLDIQYFQSGDLRNILCVLCSSIDTYNTQYLTGIDVEVSNTNKTDSFLPTELCISYNVSSVPAGALLNLTCIQPVVGRYVTIKRNGGSAINALTLCEVEVVSLYAGM